MRSKHPYSNLPDACYWRRSMSSSNYGDIDPVSDVKFDLAPSEKIVTAGSCFAQHLASRLKAANYNYLVTEPPHPLLTAEMARTFNYGTFSARYGNIYTPRQLLQLIKRAYGQFVPVDEMWGLNGALVDPFRSQIQPNGFASVSEFRIDRRRHFQATRRAFEEMDVFIFTLGLTEAWLDRRDGSVYPTAPGVAGGSFDSDHYAFHNFSLPEIVSDMTAALDLLRQQNSRLKVILTVSPVPLVATASMRHVLQATTLSKSILRVACEEVCRESPLNYYFPSYEIVTGNTVSGNYFLADRRSVAPEAVNHVMKLFFRHLTSAGSAAQNDDRPRVAERDHLADMQRLMQVNCDEEILDRQRQAAASD
jgi:hypothetical protein